MRVRPRWAGGGSIISWASDSTWHEVLGPFLPQTKRLETEQLDLGINRGARKCLIFVRAWSIWSVSVELFSGPFTSCKTSTLRFKSARRLHPYL
jgi:hypothetical protein